MTIGSINERIDAREINIRSDGAECWDGNPDTSIGTDDHAKVLSCAVALGHL